MKLRELPDELLEREIKTYDEFKNILTEIDQIALKRKWPDIEDVEAEEVQDG